MPPSLIVQKKRQKNVIVGQLTGGRALPPMSNVMRIYIKQKYGGQGLINMEECCLAESWSIDHYLANSDEVLLKVVASLEKLHKDKIESNSQYNRRIEQEKNGELRDMGPHGLFEWYIDKKKEESWNWLRHGNLNRETESLLSVAQKKPLNSTSIWKIYHKDVSDKCKLSGSHVETILHSVYGCNALAQKDYKRRHKLCWNIHWAMCKILKFCGMFGFKWIDR